MKTPKEDNPPVEASEPEFNEKHYIEQINTLNANIATLTDQNGQYARLVAVLIEQRNEAMNNLADAKASLMAQ